MLSQEQADRRYHWPSEPLSSVPGWSPDASGTALWRSMPEADEDVAVDSRWPSFFPSPICLVTTGEGKDVALEKVVGPSIVNRFPYVVALSFCKDELSARHYARSAFCNRIQATGKAVVQFIEPGPRLDAAMGAIAQVPERATGLRIAAAGLATRAAVSQSTPMFEDAFMAYEAELVSPSLDWEGASLYEQPWTDIGSHRVYFLKITTIQLREDIARGQSQIRWRSLPAFSPAKELSAPRPAMTPRGGYLKGYTANYAFPAPGTIAFEADYVQQGMAVKHLGDETIAGNDDSRWPCFFPQSAGLITSRSTSGLENVMPCGSTTVVSRQPLVIAPCISYAAVNERYAPRASLRAILESSWFGCGVPYVDDTIIKAIRYTGNTSLRDDVAKLLHSGMNVEPGGHAPILSDLPVFYECRVVGHQRLGTHVIVFGEVQRIRVRADVTPDNPLEWCPWSDPVPVADPARVGVG